MIDLNKKYTTVGGYEVVLYDIVDTTVFGRYYHPLLQRWNMCVWSISSGKCESASNGNFDLVEVPEFRIVSHNIKKVTYFGILLTVPYWTKWIAVNGLGEIQIFDDVPSCNTMIPRWNKNNSLGDARYLAINIGYTGDWKKSLREV